MVATLTRIFGLEHLALAEDVVQEALVRALQTWPFYGVPENPAAWIMRASRNLALDVVRREKVFRNKEAEIVHLIEGQNPAPDASVLAEQETTEAVVAYVCRGTSCDPPLTSPDAFAAALQRLDT